ncbi:hypothetical protein [Paludisphaera mucosa]|uniref:Lipoprotein n=1 Tax=Paludisphaera mucosa TaxID=3030827 RepID=A0ABT6FF70_9BACT|nr:hypothetical protein [Paludisphaera mucosa]MDG3006222.1 hypothetical protein [Paludisphaera mucosa]
MKFPQRSMETLAVLALVWAGAASSGCHDASPPPVSPVVSADSEAGKKALAEDEAERRLRKEQEAKAATKKKFRNLPQEG